jgi:hypothetical protein
VRRQGEDDVWRERDQFRRVSAKVVGIGRGPAGVDPQVAAVGPAQLRQALQKRRHAGLIFRIIRGRGHQHADAPDPLALLRACREWPHGRRASEHRDELAASHSITSSAVASSASGTVRPSILAVETLTTSSNLVGCTTGKSAGFAPLRMRPA